MLKIAICDDQPTELEALEVLTREYAAASCPDTEIAVFSHPDALLTACEKRTFHIYILDIVMPMVDGISLGRELRRLDRQAQIIYATTEPQFALDAYAVSPLHYLIKPVDKTKLFAALDLAAEKMDYGEETTITVKTKNGLRTISTDVIALCEYKRHTVLYTLKNGEIIETTTISGSFAEHIAPLFRDKRFIQPHAAFAVNMSHVERLDKDGFTLKGGAFAPVSGKQYTVVRNAYMDYRLSPENCKTRAQRSGSRFEKEEQRSDAQLSASAGSGVSTVCSDVGRYDDGAL